MGQRLERWRGNALMMAMIPAMAMAVHASAQGSPEPSVSERLTAVRKHEDRLVVIGERLSTAAARAGWCSGSQSLGWTLGDLGQYPKEVRQQVRAVWQLPVGATLFVAAVAPDGAAARAGVTPGTAITRINERNPMRHGFPYASRTALAASERVIDAALATGPLPVDVQSPDGVRRTVTLSGRPACDTRFEIDAEDEEQAYADGKIVQVTAGMAAFAVDDDELAAVVAHELAHNILRHIARSRDADLPNNYTRYLNRYSRISRKMEEEADRLSVWLLANAGYDAAAPLAFWERFGPDHDSAHPYGRLHDPWRLRVVAVAEELALMRTQRRAHRNARPALLDRATVVPVPGAP